MGITTATSLNTEIVVQERKVTNEFIILQIHENIRDRQVRVDIELGPFTEITNTSGEIIKRGSSVRSILVWQGDMYDTIRDAWTNEILVNAVTARLTAGA